VIHQDAHDRVSARPYSWFGVVFMVVLLDFNHCEYRAINGRRDFRRGQPRWCSGCVTGDYAQIAFGGLLISGGRARRQFDRPVRRNLQSSGALFSSPACLVGGAPRRRTRWLLVRVPGIRAGGSARLWWLTAALSMTRTSFRPGRQRGRGAIGSTGRWPSVRARSPARSLAACSWSGRAGAGGGSSSTSLSPRLPPSLRPASIRGPGQGGGRSTGKEVPGVPQRGQPARSVRRRRV